MRVIHSVTFAYDTREDRLLAVVNAGQSEAWACWLTRRLVMAVLGQVPGLVERSSEAAQKAPVEFRSDLIAFEREAAMAQTAQALSTTGNDVLQASAKSAELADRISITAHGDKFQLEIHGGRGGTANGIFERPYLQRLLQMLQNETVRAGWLAIAAIEKPTAAPVEGGQNPKPVRH